MRKFTPWIVGLGLLCGLVYAFWPKPRLVDIAEVTRGPMEVTVDEEGKTRIRERYVISAPLAGQLRRITLKSGDPVKAGKTLIAVIEPSDPALLDARSLAESQARVKAAEASVAQAGPNLERARVALEFAQSEYRRARQLAERQSVSPQELQNFETQLRIRTEELKAAQFAEQIARFELELAQAALLRVQPQKTDADTRNPNGSLARIDIRSPIDGRVLHVFQESAMVVAPGTKLIEVGDPADLEVEVDVLSSDAVQIEPGAPVRLEHWGGDRPLLGAVRLVEPAAFTKVSALGVEEQRVNVLIDFTEGPQARAELGDGYRVEARIVTWRKDDVVRVPASALFRSGEDWSVFQVVDGHARLAKIKIGHTNAQYAEVLEGLSPGDRVVVHPSDNVADGVAVIQR